MSTAAPKGYRTWLLKWPRASAHLYGGTHGMSMTAPKENRTRLLKLPNASAQLYVGPRGMSITASQGGRDWRQLRARVSAPIIRWLPRSVHKSAPAKSKGVATAAARVGPTLHRPRELPITPRHRNRAWAPKRAAAGSQQYETSVVFSTRPLLPESGKGNLLLLVRIPAGRVDWQK